MGRKMPRKFDYAAIREDFASGMLKADIQRKHGCGPISVNAALKEGPKSDEPDAAMSEILTDAFRKHLGYCPIADGPRDEATS
jgi:hypothetical protein